MRAQHRQHLEQPHVDEVLPTEERRLEARLHPLEFGPVFVQETAKAGRVRWSESGDLLFHAGHVGRGVEFAAVPENDSVLRIEPNHLDLLTQRRSGRPKNFLEDARIEKKSGAEIEFEAVGLNR